MEHWNGTIYGNISSISEDLSLSLLHLEDGHLWPALPYEIFSDPQDIRKSAKIITLTTDPYAFLYAGAAISLAFAARIFKPKKDSNEPLIATSRLAFMGKLLCFATGSLVIIPLAAALAVTLVGYRFLVNEYLKRSIGGKYVGLLKGPDVLWALETDSARAVVNVLVTVEAPPNRRHGNKAIDFLRFMRKVTANSLLAESTSFPKLLYRRGVSKLGYYFWKQSDDGHNVEEYVRNFEVQENYDEAISEDDLQNIVAEHSNSPFPYGDTGTWEILVGQKPLSSSEGVKLYPIIFRVHHSVGDGVALLRLLLEGLADRGTYEQSSAEGKQRIWALSHKKEVEPSVMAINDCNERSISGVGISTSSEHMKGIQVEHETNLMVNMSANERFRKQFETKNSTIKDIQVKTKKPTLERLRNSFRLLRHGPDKTEPIPQVKALKYELQKPASGMAQKYAPIKGLGNSAVRTRLSAMRLLTRSTSSIRENRNNKNTCMVLPVPRKPEYYSSLSLHECLTTQKQTAIVSQTKLTERPLSPLTCDEKENDAKRNIANHYTEVPFEENFTTCTFEKCGNIKIQNATRIEGEGLRQLTDELPQIPRKPEVNHEKMTIRDIALNMVVAVIVCITCIKNSTEVLCTDLIKLICKISNSLIAVPYMLFDQAFGKTEDQILYGKQLSGKKVVSWIMETAQAKEDELIKSKIRKIRETLGGGLKFSDILMACVSRSLEKHYNRSGGVTPSSIKVVLPARVSYDDLGRGMETTAVYKTPHFTAKVTRLFDSRRVMKAPYKWENISINSSTESEPEEKRQEKASLVHAALTSPSSILHKADLENKFTVALLKLPIDSTSNRTRSMKDDLTFIYGVQEQCRKLRNAPDYMVNYWLLRWVAHLFPSFLVRPFLGGGPCSLVLSNLPGPEDPVYLSGKCIQNIIFWVPNRGLNGLGIGMLSYRGRFSMGIIADQALIAKKDEAKKIVSDIFKEVERLYQNTCQSENGRIS